MDAVLAREDIHRLKEEGYTFIHRPNTCMAGYTRKIWTIDEENKVVIDAAPVERRSVWDVRVLEDITPEDTDSSERQIIVCDSRDGHGPAAVYITDDAVKPDDILSIEVTGMPLSMEFSCTSEGPLYIERPSAGDINLFRGRIKEVRTGEYEFVRIYIDTDFGILELTVPDNVMEAYIKRYGECILTEGNVISGSVILAADVIAPCSGNAR